jgi:hypothetical protein
MKTRIIDKTTRTITLTGRSPIMFDRYAGDNKTKLLPEDKMYFLPGTTELCLPSINIISFLSAKNSKSVARLIGGKAFNTLADAFLSFIEITPENIPLLRDNRPIVFHGFTHGRDEQSHIIIERHVARLAKGIPNPKERPVLKLPWELTFDITFYKNEIFDETLLVNAFREGGLALGLGTFRGVYGKFDVQWNNN